MTASRCSFIPRTGCRASPDHSEKIVARIGADLKENRWMSPQESSLIDSILARVEEKAASDDVRREASGLRDRLRPSSAKAERLVALQKGFPGYEFRLGSEGSVPPGIRVGDGTQGRMADRPREASARIAGSCWSSISAR